MSALKGFKHKLDSRRYSSAALLGLPRVAGVVRKARNRGCARAGTIWRATGCHNRLIRRIGERMEREGLPHDPCTCGGTEAAASRLAMIWWRGIDTSDEWITERAGSAVVAPELETSSMHGF